jgi:predicted RNase H-like HicB family nuclease
VANAKTTPRLEVSIEGIRVEIEKDASTKAYVTYVPALGNLSTFGTTLEEALDHTRDMLLTYIVSMDDDGMPLPFSKAEVKRLRRALQAPLLDRMSS